MRLGIKSFEPGDKYIIDQTLNEYSCISEFLKDARVLDIGAHIGCFSVMALMSGASCVVSVEPVPISVAHLRKNLEFAGDRSVVIEAAVGANDGSTTMRWLGATWRSRPPKDNRMKWQGRPYKFVTVRTTRFAGLLEIYEPTLIKLDCEGAEYDILESVSSMPESVRTITVEWHKFTEDAYDRYEGCIGRLRAWGFTTDREVRVGPKAFNSWGNFIRPIAWRRK